MKGGTRERRKERGREREKQKGGRKESKKERFSLYDVLQIRFCQKI